jgi:tetratricopeptide (TPR) repeat protein
MLIKSFGLRIFLILFFSFVFLVKNEAVASVVPTPLLNQQADLLLKPAKPIQTQPVTVPAVTDNTELKKLPKEKVTPLSQDKIDAIAQLRDEAKVLYNSNNLSAAFDLFNKIPDAEKVSDDWLFLANIAQDNSKTIDAVFYLKKAIQLDDDNYKAHYNLANLYYSDDKLNMALSEYKKALKIKKDLSYAYYNRGCCYLKKQSWINAKYEFGLAIKANPHEPSFYYNLAYTYKKMNKIKKAQEALAMYNNLMAQ